MVRRKLASKLSDIGFQSPIICAPSAIVSPTAAVGEEAFTGKRAVLNAEVQDGQHCIINTGAILQHESTVGDFTHVSIDAIACGNCYIGDDCFVGAGSTLVQGIRADNNSIIGAGALVKCDLPSGCTAVGVPARIV